MIWERHFSKRIASTHPEGDTVTTIHKFSQPGSTNSVDYEPPAPPPPPPPPKPPPALDERNASVFEAPRRPRVDLTGASAPQATSLSNEVVGDGQSNCLENAHRAARPGDQVLLYRDVDDPVGHAIVERPDGTVVDPNEPGRTYASRAEWEANHTDYTQPEAVKQEDLARVLGTPPGPAREAVIKELGLSALAKVQVADGGVRQEAVQNLVNESWYDADLLNRVISGQEPPGPLSHAEQAQLGKLLVEKHLAEDGGVTLATIGENAKEYPQLARALGRAYQAGTLTDAHVSKLLGNQGLGGADRAYEYNGIANLVAASGSPGLQSSVSTRIWDLAAGARDISAATEFQAAAMQATGGSAQATQALLKRAGSRALTAAADNVGGISSRVPLEVHSNRFATALGTMLTGLSRVPSSVGADAVGARAVSHLSQYHLDNAEANKGFFDYLRSARSSPSWRGMGPAGGTFTENELLSKFQDPAIRNHIVTEQYYRLSQGMEDLLPGQANWSTFAVWASRQAGSAIRGEPLGGLSGIDGEVAEAISHGNTLVASEVAPLFAAFTNTLKRNPNASFDDVWRAAGSPNKPILREAFQNYHEAFKLQRAGGNADAVAEKMLVANGLVGQHEQTALQADIERSMSLGPVPLAGLLGWTMDLELPGRTLHLDQDLTGTYPPELRSLSDPRAQELARKYGGLQGTGTSDWPNLQQRMEFIFNLFRLNQKDTSLLGEWIR